VTALQKWQKFEIAAQHPKMSRASEKQLFEVLRTSSLSAGVPELDYVSRAQKLLNGITLSIRKEGRYISVQESIRDEIVAARMGQGAVTRDFIFERYEQYYESYAHTSVDKVHMQLPTTAGANIPTNSSADQSINCRVCKKDFIFSVGEQQFYQGKGLSRPGRCPPCSKSMKANIVFPTSIPVVNAKASNPAAAAVNGSEVPVVVVCRECSKQFEESPKYWADRGLYVPKSCKACLTARQLKLKLGNATVVLALETNDPPERVWGHDSDDSDDYDSFGED